MIKANIDREGLTIIENVILMIVSSSEKYINNENTNQWLDLYVNQSPKTFSTIL